MQAPERRSPPKRHFRFVGGMGAYYFLYVVGEQVPPHEEGMALLGRRAG
jgi:hypothetical protein